MADRVANVRLPVHPAHQVDSSRRVRFYFNGQPVDAFAGDSVATALFASGRRIFTRSFKYHRPRGLLCCSGDCPNCLMEVDGTPSVRTCRVQVRDGMQVVAQHAWPSLDHDALHIIELFGRLLPVGFYYKTLHRPKFLWNWSEPLIRRLAGLGVVHGEDAHDGGFEHRHETCDVLVVGGGPAGMNAALRAAQAGASVILVDSEPQLGGHLRYETRASRLPGMGELPVYEVARKLAERIHDAPNIRVLTEANAFGTYEGLLIPVLQGKHLIHIRASALIVATGCHESPLVFRNNDLPGIMLGRGALRMMNLFGIRPGKRAVVVTAGDDGYDIARECLGNGLEVVQIADARPAGCADVADLAQQGIAIQRGLSVREAIGWWRLKAVRLGPVDPSGQTAEGPDRVVACDLLILSAAWQPAAALLYQAGCRLQFDHNVGYAVPKTFSSGVFGAGELLGMRSLPSIFSSGEEAGENATAFLKSGPKPRSRMTAEPNGSCSPPAFSITPVSGDGKHFVCFCEDVLEKDIRHSIAEGFDEIETLKRYSTVSMGPCQGRMCARASAQICASATGKPLESIGTTTARPPVVPVPLGALAGPEFHPTKLTSMHYSHAALNPQVMDMGPWKRPYLYTSVADEYEAVRARAGLIDVSTLGKLIVKGRDASLLLDKVYTHFFSSLRPGRMRYGTICDDSGIILDDGTVARLAEELYYITTTTGNADFVEQWFKWWAAGSGWCVHISNVTSGYAAVNLAGPKARDVLAKLTDVDLSSTAFPYMACREGSVAGVPAMMLRIGFVGETGWELHFPAECGEYLWDAILEAGRDAGIQPFGVETQRLLRLEKKHVIVGQDTDALSNPYEAGMAWVVKLEKSDFIGKHALQQLAHQPLRNRLVGFRAAASVRPQDGDAITVGGKFMGRITSVRYSPTAKEYVGLGWVPVEHSEEGAAIELYANGEVIAATITNEPFYDPQGARLK